MLFNILPNHEILYSVDVKVAYKILNCYNLHCTMILLLSCKERFNNMFICSFTYFHSVSLPRISARFGDTEVNNAFSQGNKNLVKEKNTFKLVILMECGEY